MAKANAAARAATPAAPVETPKASGGTVKVACKLPHGLILRIFRMVDGQETVPGGYRDVKRAEQIPGEVHLNGNAVAVGDTPRHRILAGYGITENVPKEFFETWLDQNRDHPAVLNNLVFTVGAGEEEATTREFESVRSGLEPLLKDKDPRAPSKIETAKVGAS